MGSWAAAVVKGIARGGKNKFSIGAEPSGKTFKSGGFSESSINYKGPSLLKTNPQSIISIEDFDFDILIDRKHFGLYKTLFGSKPLGLDGVNDGIRYLVL